jgi:UDP-N-acetylmuramoyl-tripeptide--D-alanyl-D-alanine ligase
MAVFMRKFLEWKLARLARRLLKREKPEIVAITGSVGKSSTKQAIAAVLGSKFRIEASPKNFNTEIGLPLTVLRLPSPGRSVLGWLGTVLRADWRSRVKQADYPKTLVLEMAADKVGDITHLCGIAKPDIAVVTAVGESHLEKFASVDAVVREKRVVVESLTKEGRAILNRDDERVWQMRERSKAAVTGYGFSDDADVRGGDVSYHFNPANEAECGTHFKITAGGATVPVFLPGVLGRHAAYAALAAAAVGIAKGMNMVEIAEALRKYEPLPGRMRCLAGIKRTMLIDDTYNAAPKSTLAAIETLAEITGGEGGKRVAVLGDMLELGSVSVSGHEEVGRRAAEKGIDLLVLVGERMGDAKKAALAAGLAPDRVAHFAKPEEAGRFVQDKLEQGDTVLIKGSRGMKMEKVTKELMAEPMRAADLLVGHHEEWRV